MRQEFQWDAESGEVVPDTLERFLVDRGLAHQLEEVLGGGRVILGLLDHGIDAGLDLLACDVNRVTDCTLGCGCDRSSGW